MQNTERNLFIFVALAILVGVVYVFLNFGKSPLVPQTAPNAPTKLAQEVKNYQNQNVHPSKD